MDAVGLFCQRPDPQFGYAELDATTTYLATTSGTRQRHTATTVRFEGSARSEDGHRSAWWGTNGLSADFAAAADHLADRLAAQRSRGDLEPGRHRVILSPSAVADLMISLAWSADGRDAVEGHNVFSRPEGGTRLGEVLTPRAIDLVADPHHPGLPTLDTVVVEADSSAESVYDNGLPIGRTAIVDKGRLSNLRASRVTAARFGLSPAYLADNLIMVDGQGHGGTGDLIARTEDAVLITSLWYIREVDPQNLLLTGLTRDGVYRVRDGVITESLPNFRFNVSVTDLLARIADASATVRCLPREWADWFTRTAMPALLVDGFNLSSRSEAS
jgi:predicted Zn-dependent protease